MLKRHMNVAMAHSGGTTNPMTVQAVRYKGLAVIPIFGTIYRHPQEEDPYFGPPEAHTAIEDLYKLFDAALADETVKGVVFVVNSPGGEANPTAEFCRYVFARRDQKPLMGLAMDMACSAGYELLSVCHTVVATTPGTMVANIGVCFSMIEDDERVITYKAGKYKAAERRRTELTDQQFQEYVNDVYSQLVDDVAKYRGIEPKAVLDTESKFMTAEKAMDYGLVDAVYPREVALDMFAGGTMPFFGNNQPLTLDDLKAQNPELVQQLTAEIKADADKVTPPEVPEPQEEETPPAPDPQPDPAKEAVQRVTAIMALGKNKAQAAFLQTFITENPHATVEAAALALLQDGPAHVQRGPAPVAAGPGAGSGTTQTPSAPVGLEGCTPDEVSAYNGALSKYSGFGGAR